MPSPLRIVCVLFPQVTQLDLTAPAQVFSRMPNTEVSFVWHDLNPVPTDAGFSIVPTETFANSALGDVIFIPGGKGAFDLFDDDVALEFIRKQAKHAQYVTSVCTGSFALAAAGLLTGRRATSHWGSLHMLSEFGVIPTSKRVVRDGRIITGAGVSSGIDFALTLTSEIFGETVAKRIQLAIEYDPAPPFDAGSPSRPDADPAQVAQAIAALEAARLDLIKNAATRVQNDELRRI